MNRTERLGEVLEAGYDICTSYGITYGLVYQAHSQYV